LMLHGSNSDMTRLYEIWLWL